MLNFWLNDLSNNLLIYRKSLKPHSSWFSYGDMCMYNLKFFTTFFSWNFTDHDEILNTWIYGWSTQDFWENFTPILWLHFGVRIAKYRHNYAFTKCFWQKFSFLTIFPFLTKFSFLTKVLISDRIFITGLGFFTSNSHYEIQNFPSNSHYEFLEIAVY